MKFTWSVEAGATFQSLQQSFTSAPILQHFQLDLPLTVEADASDFALGCILSQPSPVLVLGPLPIVPSASLVSLPNPHLCASSLVFSCASIE